MKNIVVTRKQQKSALWKLLRCVSILRVMLLGGWTGHASELSALTLSFIEGLWELLAENTSHDNAVTAYTSVNYTQLEKKKEIKGN